MAETFQDLTHLAKINDANVRDIELSDLLDAAKLIQKLHAVTASNGTSHKYLKETSAPVVGFRAVNDGRENSKSDDTLVTVDLKYMDADFDLDVAYCKGYKGGKDAAIAREAKRHLKAAMFAFEKQVINGGAGGFNGLKDVFNALANPKVVDATGSTANGATSIYLIRTNPDEKGVCAIMGNDGEISIEESTIIERTGASGKYSAWRTPIGAWMGVSVGSAHAVVRIVNVTAQAGKTATDALIYKALKLFPVDQQPNLIVMNRDAQEMLRASRTATNVTGAPAPRPTEVEGIEIVVTDAITSTEAIVA